MRTPLAFGLALSLIAAPALAIQTPTPGSADPRVRTIDYDPLQVVHITGVYRTATQILFGDSETILHVAVGDATAWDVAAEKNILFIKPKAAHGVTNLIVTTAITGGGERNDFSDAKFGGFLDAPFEAVEFDERDEQFDL